MDEMRTDVTGIGGDLGGGAAAIAAVCVGFRIVLTEQTRWVDGQLTSPAVPPGYRSSALDRALRRHRRAVAGRTRNLITAAPTTLIR